MSRRYGDITDDERRQSQADLYERECDRLGRETGRLMRLENQQRGRGLSRQLRTIDRRAGELVIDRDPQSMRFEEGASQPWSERDRDPWNTQYPSDLNHDLNRLDGRGELLGEGTRRGRNSGEQDDDHRAPRMDRYLRTMAGVHDFHSSGLLGGSGLPRHTSHGGPRHPWWGYEVGAPRNFREEIYREGQHHGRFRPGPRDRERMASRLRQPRLHWPSDGDEVDLARLARYEQDRRHGFR